MSTDPSMLADIAGLLRVESTGQDEMVARCRELTLPAYPHQQVYGTYCTIQDHVDCPPEQVYDYLRQGHHLEEWTYSLRDFEPSGVPGLWVGFDRLAEDTRIYCRTVANPDAMTVDYHCSWDQGDELWMIYLMRVIPAPLVLGRPGSVVTWTNCRHPHYDRNPYPSLAARPGRPWVGDYWDLFYAGHTVEMGNLKAILEHRYAAGVPVNVPPARAVAR
ncbi:SRPBCC family protein [Actinoplanes sp. NPDC051475]|uniref:SRPBCC family protein n=1 Tax=Actinoplanes sp. NPDC051475 TaxID=3157225 RepID=UPI003450111C